jgi:hypothetical protein
MENLDTRGWRRWQSARIEAVMAQIDDSSELWDDMANELTEREHEHQVRVLNGGILP